MVNFTDPDMSDKEIAAESNVPDGTYFAQLIENDEFESKKGNTCWGMKWEIKEGPQAGRHVDGILTFSEHPFCVRLYRQCLRALGYGIEQGKQLTIQPEEAVGKTAMIRVKVEEYDGRWNSKAKEIFAATEDVRKKAQEATQKANAPDMSNIPF